MDIIVNIVIIVSLSGVMILGFFVMKRFDKFLERNKNAVEEEMKKQEPHYIIFDADNSEEDIIKEIEKFRKKHTKTKIVVYDSDDTYFFECIEQRKK